MKRYLLALAGLALVPSSHGATQAIIQAGDVLLGIHDFGHLNVPNGPGPAYPSPANSSRTGLTLIGVGDATSPGCFCEGWGVSGSGISGYANVDTDGGVNNLNLISFTTNDVGTGPGTFANSVVSVGGGSTLTVSQQYAAAAGAPTTLFANTVTITNTGADAVTDVRYVRVMDWDVPPTEFDELVTIQGTATTTQLELSHDNGFATADPLGASGAILGGTTDVDFTDAGPTDHGAYFKFNFGTLAAGESKEFTIFYGAADNEADALNALGAVEVELYSLGQNSLGSHNNDPTYIFGFKGVGGEIIVDPVPEGGASLALFSSVLGGLLLVRRRLMRKA